MKLYVKQKLIKGTNSNDLWLWSSDNKLLKIDLSNHLDINAC